MGLFPSANDFKAGKGVEKDAPRKTGIGRFFELVGRDMNGMFLANLLTCIGFAPVICLVYIGFLQNSLPVMLGSAAVGGLLAGPALAGMYDTVLRALRDEAGYWWVTYRKAFKRNFKASRPPTAALPSITGRLFCKKPMYTRQMTGANPMQVSRFARNIPFISRPTSSKKRPMPVLRGASFSTPLPALKSLAEGKRPIVTAVPFLRF
jgi:hypothetical protein